MSRRIVMANPRSGREIENIALKIVRSVQPGVLTEPKPFDIVRFFDCDLEAITGVNTDYRPLPVGIHGYTHSGTMESVISAELMEDPTQILFVRSTMSHETGHALIHVPEFRLKKAILSSIHNAKHDVALTMHRETNVPLYRNPEWQAWRFAGALLMPELTIREAVKKGHAVRELARIFEVNPAFVETRLRALKITL